MGLDMYLAAAFYFSDWDFERKTNPEKGKEYNAVMELVGLPRLSDAPGLYVQANVLYWRKANAIHRWFVEECADGVDECQDIIVYRDRIEDLLSLCSEALDSKDPSILPPQSGFFFGSTEIDEWYWNDIERTHTELTRVLDEVENEEYFVYRASW